MAEDGALPVDAGQMSALLNGMDLEALSANPKFQKILEKHLKNNSQVPGFDRRDLPKTSSCCCDRRDLPKTSSCWCDSLPAPVKRRVDALRNLQLEVTRLEAQFYSEVQELEAKYQALYQPFLDKRAEIVSGAYQPSAEECKWEYREGGDGDNDSAGDIEEGETEQKTVNGDADRKDGAEDPGAADKAVTSPSAATDVTNIPDFWLTALKSGEIFASIIEEHDEPILQHLMDIKLVYADKKGMGFSLEFHFSENEHFTNKVLTKTYTMSCALPEDDPFSFEGATITNVKGCKIDWKKGKNVTVKTIRKKQKNKGKGQSRTIVKTVPNESFFNFFSPPNVDSLGDKGDEDEDEVALELESDFGRAEFLRDRLIPKAVLYFTGEALEEDDENDEMEDSEIDEEDEGDADDSDNDDDYNPRSDLQHAKPPECNQQ